MGLVYEKIWLRFKSVFTNGFLCASRPAVVQQLREKVKLVLAWLIPGTIWAQDNPNSGKWIRPGYRSCIETSNWDIRLQNTEHWPAPALPLRRPHQHWLTMLAYQAAPTPTFESSGIWMKDHGPIRKYIWVLWLLRNRPRKVLQWAKSRTCWSGISQQKTLVYMYRQAWAHMNPKSQDEEFSFQWIHKNNDSSCKTDHCTEWN